MASDLTTFIDQLQNTISQGLPGESEFFQFGKYSREERLKQIPRDGSAKLSATMLLLYEKPSGIHFVLTERRKYPGVHSGQISFPGGKKEESDTSMEVTALRETEEEVGIASHSVQVIGQLTEVYIPPSNFLVYPHVGFKPERPNFEKQEEEVETIIEVSLEEFLNDDIEKLGKVEMSRGLQMKVPYFDIQGHMVWGATAIILSEFKQLVLNK